MARYNLVNQDELNNILQRSANANTNNLVGQKAGASAATGQSNSLESLLSNIGNTIGNIGTSIYGMIGSGVASAKDLAEGTTGGKTYNVEGVKNTINYLENKSDITDAEKNELNAMYDLVNKAGDKDTIQGHILDNGTFEWTTEGKNTAAFKRGLYGADENDNINYGKAAGQSLDAAATLSNFIPGANGLVGNALQGAAGGIGAAYQQGGNQTNLEDALKAAAAGGLAGAATAGVNSKINASGNKLLQSKLVQNPLTRGAISGAVGGAVGGGTAAGLAGGDIASTALEGALSGAGQGAIAGGLTAGANKVLGKTKVIGGIQNALGQAEQEYQQAAQGKSGLQAFKDYYTGQTEYSPSKISETYIGDAVNAVKDKIKNPKIGLGIEDVSGQESITPKTTAANEAIETATAKTPLDVAEEATAEAQPTKQTVAEQTAAIEDSTQKLREAKSRKAREDAAKNLLNQAGTASKPAAKAYKMVDNVVDLSARGLTTPEEWEVASDAITGRNGKLSELYTRAMNAAGEVDTTSGIHNDSMEDTITKLIGDNGLTGTSDETAIRTEIESALNMLPSRQGGTITGTDDATEVMDVIRNLEAHRRNYLGEYGSNYSTTTPYKEQKAKVLGQLATILEDRIYDKIPDVSGLMDEKTVTGLKNIFPNNQKWADYVDNDIATIKTGKQLRAAQKGYVQTSNYLQAIKENYGTYGQKVGDAYGNALSQAVKKVPLVGGLLATAADSPAANQLYAKLHNADADYYEGKTNVAPAAAAEAVKSAIGAKSAIGGGTNPTTPTATPKTSTGTATATPSASTGTATATPSASTGTATATPQSFNATNAADLYNLIGQKQGSYQAANTLEQLLGQQAGAQNATMTVPDTSSLQNAYSTASTGTSGASGLTSANTGTSGTASTGNNMLDTLAYAAQLALQAGDMEAFSQLAELYSTASGMFGTSTSTAKTAADLNSTQQANIAKLESAGSALDELESLFAQAGGGQGVIGGNVANFLGSIGLNSDVSTYNQLAEGLINQIGAAIGKTDSLNTEGEVQRALSLIPKITDDATTAQNKLTELRKILGETKTSYYTTYGITQ